MSANARVKRTVGFPCLCLGLGAKPDLEVTALVIRTVAGDVGSQLEGRDDVD